ncbi:MAG: hypothetical protein N2Z73_01000, partial [Endomicrobia bacterium]|nr:hypothetical protein [Endomicrobiia bacterium]
MSIRTKFAVFIFCLVALIILGISVNIFLLQRKLLKEQMEEYRKKIFEEFCFACKESLIVKDELSVLNLTKSVIETHNPQVVYAGYISPTGIKLFNVRDKDKYIEYEYRIYPTKTETTEFFKTAEGEIVDEFVKPLYSSDNEYLGTIKAGFSRT